MIYRKEYEQKNNEGIVSVVSCSFRRQNVREGDFASDDFMECRYMYSSRMARCGRSNISSKVS